MAKKTGTLHKIGILLTLFGGIVALIKGVFSLLNMSIDILGLSGMNMIGDNTLGYVAQIVVGLVLIAIVMNKISINEGFILGLLILILGFVGGGWLAVLGGLLIVLDSILK
ncbi:MAG: hypothetical protein INQ03_10930 [Candidatus Heimdallarchaeota archaeon]|nr:hypothetical protein [Candidatus Heimdallarchaeota archaeon]